MGFTKRLEDGILIFTVRTDCRKVHIKNIMSNTTRNTQKSRLFNLLAAGKEITVNEARKRCRIANPTAVISRLREEGAVIYTNVKKTSGRTTYAYRMGTTTLKSLYTNL